MGNEKGILILPFDLDDAARALPIELRGGMPERIASALNRGQIGEAVVFSNRSPIIQRAIRERRLTQTQVSGPMTVADSGTVAKEFMARMVVGGSIASYTYDKANNSAEVSLSLDVRDMSAGRTRVVAVNGTSQASSVVSTELALATEAANNAALSAAAAIGGVTVETLTAPPVAPPVKVKRKSKGGGIAIIAGVALLAIILSSGNRGSGGGSSNGNGNTGGNNPPPAPNL